VTLERGDVGREPAAPSLASVGVKMGVGERENGGEEIWSDALRVAWVMTS